MKPTLKLLEDRFKLNEYLRKPFRDKLKAEIDKVISQAIALEQFKNELKKAGVSVIIRQNSDGRIYGLSYIDHPNKAIFNGSDLGKNYSAATILDALQYRPTGNVASSIEQFSEKAEVTRMGGYQAIINGHSPNLLDDLLDHYDPNGNLPNQFGPKKKKKKRRNLNL